MASRPDVDEWIARDAIRFVLDDASSFDAAVDRVVPLLDDSVRLLGLGEALHGSEEILVARNRLFRRHGHGARLPRDRDRGELSAGKRRQRVRAGPSTGQRSCSATLVRNRVRVARRIVS